MHEFVQSNECEGMRKREIDALPVVRDRCARCLPATRQFHDGASMAGVHRAWCDAGLWPDGPPVRPVVVCGTDGGVMR